MKWLKSLNENSKVLLLIALITTIPACIGIYFQFKSNYTQKEEFSCKKVFEDIQLLKTEIELLINTKTESDKKFKIKAEIELKKASLKGKIKTYDKRCKN